jgi:predicted MFS family arabinose efflux permease
MHTSEDEMDDVQIQDRQGRFHRRLVLPSLMFSMFATYPTTVVASLLLLDMGVTFNCPIGVIAQMTTISSMIALISASALGAFSFRFQPKTLLILGLLFLGVSAFGSGSATSLGALFASYALTGLGTSMVEPMISTLIADYFPADRRSRIIGWVTAGGGLSYTIGGSAVGLIAGLWGWRIAFLGYAMILPFIAVMIISLGIPSIKQETYAPQAKISEVFKSIFTNRSAVVCLLGNFLASAACIGLYVFSFSFLRENYQMTTGWAAIVFSMASICFFLGSLLSGAFIDRLGRRLALISSLLLIGLSIIAYTNLQYMVLGVAFAILGHLFSALRYSASLSLSLEQVPHFRGSMMSMNSAVGYAGMAVGTALGGFMLLLNDWRTFGVVFGTISFVGALLYYVYASDPTKNLIK